MGISSSSGRGAALAILAASTLLGVASGADAGTIIGVFGGVVTQGSVINYPTIGQNYYLNNAGTAYSVINNSADPSLGGTPPIQLTGSSLLWGDYPPGYGVSPEDSFSQLTFFGAPTPADTSTAFQIGTITYLNGTSQLNSQIFAATLSFYDNSVSQANYLGTDMLYINTTENYNVSIEQDADWINICGNYSSICDSRVEAYEDSEGGTGVTVNLFGEFVGDPRLDLTSVQLAPGQSTTTNGFIGEGPQMSVAEPAAWTMMLLGFGLIGGALRRLGASRPAPSRA